MLDGHELDRVPRVDLPVRVPAQGLDRLRPQLLGVDLLREVRLLDLVCTLLGRISQGAEAPLHGDDVALDREGHSDQAVEAPELVVLKPDAEQGGADGVLVPRRDLVSNSPEPFYVILIQDKALYRPLQFGFFVQD